MKKNNLLILSVFSFLFIALIGLTGCDDKATPTTTEYTVTFDAGTGGTLTSSATVKVKSGEKVTKPTDPTRPDYTFVEWRKTGATTAFNFATETITADITLTAQWKEIILYTVTFDPDQGVLAGGNNNNTVQVVAGGKVTKPTDPTRPDYTFVEWRKTGATAAFNFATETITANITLTAQWEQIQYTVIFDANKGMLADGTTRSTFQVAAGAKITKPTDPTRTDYTFLGWQSNGSPFEFNTQTVNADITITAQWILATTTTFTVAFAGVGVTTPAQTVPDGGMASQPPTPTRDGFTFVEWRKTGATTAFNFATETITANITLTAQWVDAIDGSLADVAIVLNDANTAYEVNYKYTNPQGSDTGGTPEVTWFLSDNADGTSPTQVSTEATYTLAKENRYTKYLVASVRVMAATGEVTPAVTVVRSPGFSTQATRGATGTRFSGRSDHASVRFKDKIWVIGGSAGDNLQNDLWSSADGITWTKAPGPTAQNTRFSPRSSHTAVAFKNSIWVIGGYDGKRKNDVWSSTDGSNWVKKADETEENPRFSARSSHTAVVFKDKIWVIGGSAGGNLQNDVWSSADGITWTQAPGPTAQNTRFSPRINHTSVVRNDTIWVIGGSSGGKEVWSSTDGATWTQVTNTTTGAAFSSLSSHTSVVLDDKIWVIGGYDGVSKNDVWSSEDGENWIEYPEVPERSRFFPLQRHTSVVLDDKIWVIGGDDGGSMNDVWY